MNIDPNNLHRGTLIQLVRDLNGRVWDLEESRKYLQGEVADARKEAINWKNQYLDLQGQELPYNEPEIKNIIIDQLCKTAQGLGPHGTLALLGTVYESGFKVAAIEAYRQKNKVTITEAKETIENWRNILGLPENDPQY